MKPAASPCIAALPRACSTDIELAGEAPNSRAQVLEKMHEVIGRNVFQISLAGA